MRRIMLAPISLFLASCSATTPPPAVEVRTVEVKVPVPVACISAEQYRQLIDREPAKVAAQLNGDARHDLDVISASAIRLRAYAGELRAALKACAN